MSKIGENIAQKRPWSDVLDYVSHEIEVPKTARIFNIRLVGHLRAVDLDWDTSPWWGVSAELDTFFSCLPEENIPTEWNSFSLLAWIPIFKY